MSKYQIDMPASVKNTWAYRLFLGGLWLLSLIFKFAYTETDTGGKPSERK